MAAVKTTKTKAAMGVLLTCTLLLALAPMSVEGGFDFGSGCAGSSGSFPLSLTTKGGKTTVGTLPKGLWNLRVRLTATSDVDVQLYDLDDTSKFSEGQAVVAWCADASTCNIGALGSDAKEGSVVYSGMKIGYSGYEGVGGKPGKEWITITGELTSDLSMQAYAFETGEAIVEYESDRVQTACCLATAACGGSFSADIAEGASAEIGSIPTGKKNLYVKLTSSADVDIQLYDKDDTDCASEGGRAIIAYQEAAGCGKGFLGNNDAGDEESYTYKDRLYEYSGYNGDGTNYGNEWVRVNGVSNAELMMKAYGYAAGAATVTYEYWEDYDSDAPAVPSVDWLETSNHAKSNTDDFTDVPDDTLVVRRATDFNIVVSNTDGVSAETVSAAITGVVADNDDDSQNDDSAAYPAESVSFEVTQDGDNKALVVGSLAVDAPIGRYTLTLTIGGFAASTTLVILANPYKSKDVTYTSKANRVEYVENAQGLVWQGLSDNNNGYSWDYAQFAWDNVDVALDAVRRMPIADRGDMALVARHITYSVGADICYGKWGEGSYTTGRPSGGYRCSDSKKCYGPDHWTGTTELFALHKTVEKPVQYCQCFVYAAVVTSVGRSLGIPTRPVSNFQSAHDTEKNRAIDKFYQINGEAWDPVTDDAPTSDSVWSFHVWNEMYFDRPDLNGRCSSMGLGKNCANGWQAVDATPQEESAGGSGVPAGGQYQMGPASIKLLKANKDPVCDAQTDAKYGCYDNEFVISEVNADVQLWTRTSADGDWVKHGERFPTDPFGDEYNTVGLQISTKKKGGISALCLAEDDTQDCSAELDDVTKYYKLTEPSSPGDPTIAGSAPDIENGDSSHRRIRGLRELSGEVNVGRVNFTSGLGVNPSSTSVLVNEDHHPASWMKLTLPFENVDAAESEAVTCSFTAWMIDYRGVPFAGNGSVAASTVSTFTSDTVTLAPGESGSCDHTVERDAYKMFSSTYLDDGLPDMEEDEKAYAMRMSVVVRTGSGGIYEASHDKMICTPVIGASTRSGTVRCEAHRGTYIPDSSIEEEGGALYHLTEDGDDNCDGVTNGLAGDGYCHDTNNVDGCWDGGDCCMYSCFYFHGGAIMLDDDGTTVVPNHECNLLDEAVSCKDPQFKDGYVPVPDFTKPASPVAFGGEGGAEDFGESVCPDLVDGFEAAIAADCDADPCSADCIAMVEEQLCETDAFVRLEVDCMETLLNETLSSCNVPRCSKRTIQGCRCVSEWTYTHNDVDGETYTGNSCGNPDGSADDWCPVVAGSCDTGEAGNPEPVYDDAPWDDDLGMAYGYYDYNYDDGYYDEYPRYDSVLGSGTRWWDKCGSSATATAADFAWSDAELSAADIQFMSNWKPLVQLDSTPPTPATDDESSLSSFGTMEIAAVGGAVVVIAVLGVAYKKVYGKKKSDPMRMMRELENHQGRV